MSRTLIIAAALMLASIPSTHVSNATPSADRKSYKTNADGLKKLIQDLARSAERGDLQPFAELAIPDHSAWFAKVFGESVSASMAPVYEAGKAAMAEGLARALTEASRTGKMDIHINHFRLGGTSMALKAAMTNPAEIFSVALSPENDGRRTNLGFFVVADGRFRYLGRMYVLISPDEPAMTKDSKVRLLLAKTSDIVQDPWLVEQPPPRYPRELRQRGIQGAAKVFGFIAEDGTVANLAAAGGSPQFTQATLDAVGKWRYKPLLFNGVYLRALVFVEITYSLSVSPRFP